MKTRRRLGKGETDGQGSARGKIQKERRKGKGQRSVKKVKVKYTQMQRRGTVRNRDTGRYTLRGTVVSGRGGQ